MRSILLSNYFYGYFLFERPHPNPPPQAGEGVESASWLYCFQVEQLYYQKGGCYFFTVVAHERRTILIQPDIRAALRKAIGKIRANYPFIIHAWVLLPDHLHAIWQLPEGDSDFSLRWNQIKRHVSFRCAYDKPIWQPRFWEHCLRDEADFQRHFDYVHWNPVKHGHVAQGFIRQIGAVVRQIWRFLVTIERCRCA